jgi:autotransporter-associated beta strand protein
LRRPPSTWPASTRRSTVWRANQLKVSNSNSAQQSTLTLNNAIDKSTSSTSILDGAGTIRLVKQGNFTQTLLAANNYSGTTTIEAGQILFGQQPPSTTAIARAGPRKTSS